MASEEQEPEYVAITYVPGLVGCRHCYMFYIGWVYKGMLAQNFPCPHCGVEDSAYQIESLLYMN